MEQLRYELLDKMGYQGYYLKEAPERILQFGEGNFLRAFVDYFVDVANEKQDFNTKVVVVQPIANGMVEQLNQQQGLYTHYRRGKEGDKVVNEKRLISSISRGIDPYRNYNQLLECAHNPDLRFVLSNTTEAGITYDSNCNFGDQPPASFPAKLTRFLYERFQVLGEQPGKGLVILACELIDHNGKALLEAVLQYCQQWELELPFIQWLEEENIFCSTLVDSIVTGYPRNEGEALNAENGYVDNLITTSEAFAFWAIEGPKFLEQELPLAKAGLPVIVAPDYEPYRQRKVRILNGAHTAMVLAAYLAGENIVRDCIQNPGISSFLQKAINNEIVPTLTLPEAELKEFATAVVDRFNNPYIDHNLLSISLNSTSKWRARVLPTLKDYLGARGKLPPCLTFSFAAYLQFYCGESMEDGRLIGKRDNQDYPIVDAPEVLAFFLAHHLDDPKTLTNAVCSNQAFWGEDLRLIPGFVEKVAEYLTQIRQGINPQLLGKISKEAD